VTARSVFTLGVQAGDKDADTAIRRHYLQLRQLFDSLMAGSYSLDIKEFAPVLRVDGSIWHWDREGVDNVRIFKKTARATADIFVPAAVWNVNDDSAVRKYLSDQLVATYKLIADAITAADLSCDHDRLRQDIDRVVAEYRRLS
jgi:hypothetical protein